MVLVEEKNIRMLVFSNSHQKRPIKARRDQWLGEIKKTRTVDKNFLELIKNDRVYTCERHFKNEDIETCK